MNAKVGRFTKAEILELCSAFSKTSVENSIKKLVDSGELVRYGTGRSTFYVRNEKLSSKLILSDAGGGKGKPPDE